MLVGLTVRDVVLIERLELAFAPGLTVLTGETGAGKSILLDALGLALGMRAESGLVRSGAREALAVAEFDLGPGHPARALLVEQGLECDGTLILRRQLGADGRSRAFVNDQPVGVGFLKRLAETLVEIEGQFAAQGLLDPATHRGHLDAFGDLAAPAAATAVAHRAFRSAAETLAAAKSELARAKEEEEYLRHATAELELLAPVPGEEETLAAERQVLLHRGQLGEALAAAQGDIGGERGAQRQIAAAQRRLARIAEKSGDAGARIAAALERAALEIEEAAQHLARFADALDAEPQRLEKLEERLYALRDLARKHRCAPDDLPALLADLRRRLDSIESGDHALAALEKNAQAARAAYAATAEALTAARHKAAAAMERALAKELPPLKLEKARFSARLEPLPEAQWGEGGRERVFFEVATNPGATPGPIERIASGGELARFMLALKLTLAKSQPVATLVFDEVDAGIGGAAAAAVGERLQRLARTVQTLVITHSPQVAAMGAQHWRVEKRSKKGAVATTVATLDAAARREEIARMLSGARITDEARAAALELLKGAA